MCREVRGVDHALKPGQRVIRFGYFDTTFRFRLSSSAVKCVVIVPL